jgi:hypothetical protein
MAPGRPLLLLAAIAALLPLGGIGAIGAGCAPSGAGSRPVSAPQTRLPTPANRCIFRPTITSYRALDAHRIKVFADREYVVETLTRCGSLTSTESIAFRSRDGRVCDNRSDDLQTDREVCAIGAIHLAEELEKAPADR